jgi:hypothetical protein
MTQKENLMDQEAMEVLEMVKQGKVTPEQAAALLEALKSPGSAITPAGEARPRFVRIRVDVDKPGQEGQKEVAVNVNLPIALADLGLKILSQAKITQSGPQGVQTIVFGDYLKDLGGMDISAILQMVKEGAEGTLVDVTVPGGGGKPKVKVEVIVD